MNLTNLLAVGAGGFIGSVARYIAVLTLDQKIKSAFPIGTFTVNIVGSLVAGFVIGMLLTSPSASPTWRLFLVTGFCGGFTTFSAFAYENYALISGNLSMTSVAYVALSFIAGLGAVAAGIFIGKSII